MYIQCKVCNLSHYPKIIYIDKYRHHSTQFILPLDGNWQSIAFAFLSNFGTGPSHAPRLMTVYISYGNVYWVRRLMRIGLHCTRVFSKMGTSVSIASLRQISCESSPYGHYIQVFNTNINLSLPYVDFGAILREVYIRSQN